MAEQAKQPQRPRGSAELKRDYDALCRQCSDAAAQLPKLERDIRAKVEAEMGEPNKKLDALKQLKGEAHLRVLDALERERPEREAREQAETDKRAAKDRAERAAANANRKAEQEKIELKRMRDAVAVPAGI